MNLSALSMGLTRPQISGGYAAIRDAAIAAARRNNAALWYAGNSSDLTGFVYQDSTGTTPATNGAGGTGANLLSTANSQMDPGNTWATGSALPANGWSISGGKLVAGGGVSGYVRVPQSFTSGTVYQITFTISSYSSGGVQAAFGATQTLTLRSAAGTYVQTVTASGNYSDFGFNVPSDFVGSIDDVLVQIITVGDPVGLLLDRSYGAGNLGTDFATNGDFSNGLTGYSFSAVTPTIVAGEAVLDSTNVFNSFRTNTITVVPGNTYKITWRARLGTATTAKFSVQIVAGADIIPATAYAATAVMQTFQAVFTAPAGVTSIQFYLLRDSGSLGTVIVDDYKIQQLLGYPALQATATNKSTLLLQANGYYGVNFDGVNDALNTAIQQATSTQTIIIGANRRTVSKPFIAGSYAPANGLGSFYVASAGNEVFNVTASTSISTGVPIVANVPVVLTQKANSGSHTFYKNGVSIGTASTALNGDATNLWQFGSLGVNYGTNFSDYLGTLFCLSPTALPDADRIAIERFAALLSGASYV